jgi:isoamylase
VPLLLGGDEVGRTQRGNNNAYCQDNEIAWWDWSAQDLELQQFVRELIALRLAHPGLRRRSYPRHPHTQRFFTPAGEPMTDADWRDAGAKSVALVLSGSVDPDLDDDGEPMLDDDLAVLVNAWWEPLDFVLPRGDGADGDGGDDAAAGSWTILSDSYEPANRATVVAAQRVLVGPRSLVLLNRST